MLTKQQFWQEVDAQNLFAEGCKHRAKYVTSRRSWEVTGLFEHHQSFRCTTENWLILAVPDSDSAVTSKVALFLLPVRRPCNQQKTITAPLRRSKHSIPASVHFLITSEVRSFIWRRTGCDQSSHYTWLVCQHPNVSDRRCQIPSAALIQLD